jgi:hypothetical protein
MQIGGCETIGRRCRSTVALGRMSLDRRHRMWLRNWQAHAQRQHTALIQVRILVERREQVRRPVNRL